MALGLTWSILAGSSLTPNLKLELLAFSSLDTYFRMCVIYVSCFCLSIGIFGNGFCPSHQIGLIRLVLPRVNTTGIDLASIFSGAFGP